MRQGGSGGTLKAKTDLSYDARGNVLTETRGLSGETVTTTNVWTASGNLDKTTDPNGNITELTYATIGGCPVSGTDLYVTRRDEAFGKTEQRTTDFTYDCDSGLTLTQLDIDNSITTTFDYNEFGRPESVFEGNNARKTLTAYNDAGRHVTTSRSQNGFGDTNLVNVSHFDPMGRLWLEHSNHTSIVAAGSQTGGIRVGRAYRYQTGANRYELVSNPHVNGGAESTMGWTRTKFDRNGRVIEVETCTGNAPLFAKCQPLPPQAGSRRARRMPRM